MLAKLFSPSIFAGVANGACLCFFLCVIVALTCYGGNLTQEAIDMGGCAMCPVSDKFAPLYALARAAKFLG